MRASEIPEATRPGLERPASASASKELIMPATVPRKPMRGATLATVASQTMFFSKRPISKIAAFSMVFSTSSLGWPNLRRPAFMIEETGPE